MIVPLGTYEATHCSDASTWLFYIIIRVHLTLHDSVSDYPAPLNFRAGGGGRSPPEMTECGVLPSSEYKPVGQFAS
jgi:hypothetical protein